jgi:mycofactocin system transcriptional regulator
MIAGIGAACCTGVQGWHWFPPRRDAVTLGSDRPPRSVLERLTRSVPKGRGAVAAGDTSAGSAPAGVTRTGRPPSTSAGELEEVALDLFIRNGFDATTIDDVTTAAGIGRRTFFRYYPSKNDLVWGDFDGQLAMFRTVFETLAEVPMMDALRQAVVAFNRVDDAVADRHRNRMRLILTVPTLQAHSTLRYRAWRRVVEEFVAARVGASPDDFLPRLVGYVALAASVAAYEQWLVDPRADLSALIDAAFRELPGGFAHHEQR